MIIDSMVSEKIYNALQDEISQIIFNARMLYCINRDGREMFNLTNRLYPNKKEYFDISIKICVYGAGMGARWPVRILQLLYGEIPFIIDNKKRGRYRNIPIITFEEFLKRSDFRDYEIFVSVGENYFDEVSQLLAKEQLNFKLWY